ncbi:MAG TPA: nucleotidyltransferase family protein [Ktedonobacterales bacterium]|nr:nucleotidyltransferase family protein [Ktedonobacterales bacterium]
MNDARPAIAAIVLAAGKSSRMGANKLLLPLDGHPLVWHAVSGACASSADVALVVLGNEAERVAAALPPGRYQRVDNPRFAEGLSTSLQAGLDALSDNIAGALILLADMPFTSPATVEALLAAARAAPERIAAMNQGGRPTPPVYWPRAYFGELHRIQGDEGGRSLLLRSPEAVHLVQMARPDEALDVDAPEDYQRIVGGDQSSTGND